MKSFLGIFLLVLAGCATQTPLKTADEHLSLNLVKGSQWESTAWMGFYSFQVLPQMALWVENADGQVKTLFVTAKAAHSGWMDAPSQGRPEALPIWNHAKTGETSDAMSGATPAKGQPISLSDADLRPGTYRVRLEINKSFDFNEKFAKNAHNEVNGQPSLLYEGQLTVGEKSARCELTLRGSGSLDGQDGGIHSLEGLTTALQIVEKVEVIHTGYGLPH